jgi:autotransporter-associated beta strand protein
MKTTQLGASTRASLLACAALCASNSGLGADITKADNADNLNLTTSWVGGVLPGASDTALWDATVTGASTVGLGASRTIGALKIANPAGLVTINGTGLELAINSGGIDLSTATQNLTINSNLRFLSAVHQLQVPVGRTLTLLNVPVRNPAQNNDLVGGVVRVDPAGGVVKIGTIARAAILEGGANLNPFMTFGDDAWAATDASGNVIAATDAVWTASIGASFFAGPAAVSASFTQTGTSSGGGGYEGVTFKDTVTAHTLTIAGSTTFTGRGVLMSSTCVGGTITGGNIRPNRVNTGGATFPIIQNSTIGDLTLGSVIPNASSNTPVSVVKAGPGKLIVTANQGYSARTFIHGGTLQLGNGGTAGTLALASNIINNSALIINRSNDITQTNLISGTGTLTKTGAGTLILGTANTYTGATTVTGGLISIGAVGSLGSTASLTLDGGGIRWTAAADISAIPTTIGAAGATLDTATGVAVSLAGSIGNSGTGFVVKSGTGSLTLAGANTYSGGTTVSAGTLLATNGSGSATGSGAVSVASGGILGGTGIISGSVNVTTGGKVTPGTSVGTLTVGDLDLDAGSLLDYEFSGSNDLITAGAVNIDGGTIALYQEGGTTAFTTPGTYNLIAYTSLTGSPTSLAVSNQQPGFSYTFGSNGSHVTLTIATTGAVRNWTNAAGGTWADNGNWDGTFPNGQGATANFNLTGGPATVTLDGNRTVGAITFLSAANSYTIAQGSGGSLTLDNGGSGSSILDGGGVHFLNVPITLTTNTVVDTAALADSVTLGDVVSGPGTLTKTGPGSLILSGSNTFLGKLTLSGGTTTFASGGLGAGNLDIDAATLIWGTGNTDDITAGGRVITFGTNPVAFNTNGNDVSLAGDFGGVGTSALTKAGLGKLTLDADTTFSGDITISGGSLQLGTGGATGSVSAVNLVNNGQLVVNRNSDLILSSVITGTGGLAQNGPSILDINATNTFTGDTTIASGASIRLLNGLGLSGSTLVYSSTGGTLDFDSNFAATLGALSGNRNLALNNTFLGPVTLTVGGNNNSTAYTGILSGDGGLNKTGTGLMTLSTAHSYLGATNVSNGGGTGGLVLESGAVINGGAVNVTQTSQVIVDTGASLTASATSSVSNAGGFNPRLDINGGSVAFNGGLNALGNANNNYLIRLNGGTFSASTVNLGRGSLNQGLTEPGASGLIGSAGLGLVIVDGTASITGAFNVGAAGATTNSTASARVDGGSLTVGGPLTIGVNNGGRWSGFDVTGGTFTSTDAVGGVILGQTVAGPAAFLVRGGTATVERVQFGQAAVGSTGVTHVFDGALYVGTGGMVLGSSNPAFVATLKLSGGTLGAKGDWATSLPVVTANSFEVKAADATNTPFNITFSGPVTGTGSLEKTGGGTLAITGTYSYSGDTTVEAGTLTLDSGTLSDTGIVDVTTGAVLNLNFAGTDTVDEFSIDGAPQGDGTFGAIGSGADTETALITGTGILLVLPKDPFIPWASGFGLAGLDAEKTADPDDDGLSNLQEFAFDSDPTSGAASGKIRSRIETVGADQALVITLPVRNGAVFAGTPAKAATIDEVIYTIQGSNNLAAFDQAVSEIAESSVGMPALNTGWTYRSFRLDGAVPARGTAGFLRADVADAAP